jgi:hypothetical protein
MVVKKGDGGLLMLMLILDFVGDDGDVCLLRSDEEGCARISRRKQIHCGRTAPINADVAHSGNRCQGDLTQREASRSTTTIRKHCTQFNEHRVRYALRKEQLLSSAKLHIFYL